MEGKYEQTKEQQPVVPAEIVSNNNGNRSH